MKKTGVLSLGLGGVLAAALTLPVLLFGSPAGAAGGYPPPTLPASCAATGGVLVVPPSGTSTITLNSAATYLPGSTVTIIFNGVTVGSFVAPASGIITLNVTAQDPSISINGSAFQLAVYGTNTVTANGVDSTNGADGVLSCPFLITLDPGGHTVTTTTTTPGSTTTTSPFTNGGGGGGGGGGGNGNGGGGGGSGTGGVTPLAPSSAPTPSAAAPLAFTGADLEALIIGGIVLLLLGTAIVVYARRRAARPAST